MKRKIIFVFFIQQEKFLSEPFLRIVDFDFSEILAQKGILGAGTFSWSSLDLCVAIPVCWWLSTDTSASVSLPDRW